MDDITLNLIVLVVVAVIVGGIFFFVRRRQVASREKIRQMAETNGWICEIVREPLTWGLHLKSAHWTLESLSVSSGQESDSGSSNIARSTIWRAESPGSTLLIGPRTSTVSLGDMGVTLMRQALHLALGSAADGLIEVQSGNDMFQQRFMVWAQNPIEVENVLSPALQSSLLNWKGRKPLIKRTSKGLTIELQDVHLEKTDEILELINFGNTLLTQLQSERV